MILSDRQIKLAISEGDIQIDPFTESQLGPNSYDVRLGVHWAEYRINMIDSKEDYTNEKFALVRSECHDAVNGKILFPGHLYLAATIEKVGSKRYVPFLDGKSSVGRLGIFIHVTAGRGDLGFYNHWTMEISVVQPVIVYPNMPIGQFIFFEAGSASIPYDQRSTSKYNEMSPLPVASMMWKNFK